MVPPTRRPVSAQPSVTVAPSMAIVVRPPNTAQSTMAANQSSALASPKRFLSVQMAVVGKERRVKAAHSGIVAQVMGIVAQLLITVPLQVDVRVCLGAALKLVSVL